MLSHKHWMLRRQAVPLQSMHVIIGLAMLDLASAVLSAQGGTTQEAQLCLSRVAPLPKAEGYSALCTSIQSLYQQQQTAASNFLALKEEGDRTRASYSALDRRNQELEARIEQLEQYKIKREEEWQTAAKEFQ